MCSCKENITFKYVCHCTAEHGLKVVRTMPTKKTRVGELSTLRCPECKGFFNICDSPLRGSVAQLSLVVRCFNW